MKQEFTRLLKIRETDPDRYPIIINEAEYKIAGMKEISFTKFRELFYASCTRNQKSLFDYFEEYMSQNRWYKPV